jgi:hypothetical protein
MNGHRDVQRELQTIVSNVHSNALSSKAELREAKNKLGQITGQYLKYFEDAIKEAAHENFSEIDAKFQDLNNRAISGIEQYLDAKQIRLNGQIELENQRVLEDIRREDDLNQKRRAEKQTKLDREIDQYNHQAFAEHKAKLAELLDAATRKALADNGVVIRTAINATMESLNDVNRVANEAFNALNASLTESRKIRTNLEDSTSDAIRCNAKLCEHIPESQKAYENCIESAAIYRSMNYTKSIEISHTSNNLDQCTTEFKRLISSVASLQEKASMMEKKVLPEMEQVYIAFNNLRTLKTSAEKLIETEKAKFASEIQDMAAMSIRNFKKNDEFVGLHKNRSLLPEFGNKFRGKDAFNPSSVLAPVASSNVSPASSPSQENNESD